MKAWLLKLLVEMSNEEYNLPLPPLSPNTTIPSLASRLLSTNPKSYLHHTKKMGTLTSWIEEKLLCRRNKFLKEEMLQKEETLYEKKIFGT